MKRAVVVSIINIDKFTGGYRAAKIAHEDAWRSGPIPVQIVRAAQFHEFVAQLLEWGTRGDVATVPEMRTQIVSARTVAEVIADAAESPAESAGSSRSPGRGRRTWWSWPGCSPHAAGRRSRSRTSSTRPTLTPNCRPRAACCLAQGHGLPGRRLPSGPTRSRP